MGLHTSLDISHTLFNDKHFSWQHLMWCKSATKSLPNSGWNILEGSSFKTGAWRPLDCRTNGNYSMKCHCSTHYSTPNHETPDCFNNEGKHVAKWHFSAKALLLFSVSFFGAHSYPANVPEECQPCAHEHSARCHLTTPMGAHGRVTQNRLTRWL